MLLFQLSQALGVWNGHAAELMAPTVARLLAHTVLTAQHTDGLLATLGLVRQVNESAPPKTGLLVWCSSRS